MASPVLGQPTDPQDQAYPLQYALANAASDILGLLQAEGLYYAARTVVSNGIETSFILSARYPTLPIPKRFEQLERPYYDFNMNKIKSLGFTFKSIPEMFDDLDALSKEIDEEYADVSNGDANKGDDTSETEEDDIFFQFQPYGI
ncbi:hypothetical protein Tco_0377574 [Tanacetum coccineum]